MVLNAGNARIFGSDIDKVSIGPLGATLPTALETPDVALVPVGWLHTDGVPFTPSDSVQKVRGHQGGRVVRTTISESDLSFSFQALESKLQIIELQHNVTNKAVTTGVAKLDFSPGRNVVARAFVIDLYDKDNTAIHWRYVIPRGEIGERSEFAHTNGEITSYQFQVEVIGDSTNGAYLLTNDPAIVDEIDAE